MDKTEFYELLEEQHEHDVILHVSQKDAGCDGDAREVKEKQ